MPLPMTKEPTELRDLPDDELFDYFTEHARYFETEAESSQYAIRFGSRSLFSHDTKPLRERFFMAVREPVQFTLTTLFESVEDEFRKSRVESYTCRARENLAVWQKKLTGELEPPGGDERTRNCRLNDWRRSGEYVCWKRDEDAGFYYEPRFWNENHRVEGKVEHFARRPDAYYADEQRATNDANREVDQAKAAFVSKMTAKLNSALDKRDDLHNVEGKLAYEDGAISGHLHVRCRNGDEFTITMSIIVNCRYSGRWGTTSFYQYPARFKAVKLGDETKNSASEKWMRGSFNRRA